MIEYAFITFEWDDAKADSNLKKHGVSFLEASTAFYDRHAILIHDPDHSLSEDRYIILGVSARARVLTVCHCYIETNEIVRIISARKATKSEESYYWRHRNES